MTIHSLLRDSYCHNIIPHSSFFNSSHIPVCKIDTIVILPMRVMSIPRQLPLISAQVYPYRQTLVFMVRGKSISEPKVVVLAFAIWPALYWEMGFPGGSASQESTSSKGDLGLIPRLNWSPGEGNGYLVQFSGLENSMDCIDHGVVKSWTWLSNVHFNFTDKWFGLVNRTKTVKSEDSDLKYSSSEQCSWNTEFLT